MRRTRWLFLAAIIGILVYVGSIYFKRIAKLISETPAFSKPLEDGVNARSQYWTYGDFKGTQQRVYIQAKNMRQIRDSSAVELEEVEMHLFHKEGGKYDLVRCATAQFNPSAKTLFSDGKVDITRDVPIEGPQTGRIVKIHSSGVTFESESGKATTERATTFEFDQGGGSGVGAEYDPNARQLHLKHSVVLDWRGKTADSIPIHIEAGEAFYLEKESKVVLLPWAKLTRDTLHIEGEMSTVLIDNKEVRTADVNKGHGYREEENRKVEFGADRMHLHFLKGMQVDVMNGDGNGRLVSSAATMKTTVTGNHIDLDFDTKTKDSVLRSAVATGGSVAEAVPIPKPGADPGETRVLKSESITLKMRAGGKEIEAVETAGAGTVDFLPNRPGVPKRFMKGDKFWIAYGAENRISSFKSVNVQTKTDKPPDPKKPNVIPPPAFTESKDLFAVFDPKTSDLTHLEQKTDFRYHEGDRQARADHATLEQSKDMMVLDGGARVWDPTGSASADHIEMNQKSGDFMAVGHVASMRQPDPKGNSSAMLSKDEVMQARAQKMVSTDSNLNIHYEGNVIAWQGSNRVEADRLDIDRDSGNMEADGKVKSSFADKDKSEKPAPGEGPNDKAAAKTKAPPVAPIFTVVTAPHMKYVEETRIVDYTGGVVLKRPEMTITSTKIRAFLKDADSDSSLDKAFADGTVKVVSVSDKLKRTRTATSEHSEYYADDGKVLMQGSIPKLVDSIRGQTEAPKELIWFSNDDRLIVDGLDMTQPAKSVLLKKKKK